MPCARHVSQRTPESGRNSDRPAHPFDGPLHTRRFLPSTARPAPETGATARHTPTPAPTNRCQLAPFRWLAAHHAVRTAHSAAHPRNGQRRETGPPTPTAAPTNRCHHAPFRWLAAQHAVRTARLAAHPRNGQGTANGPTAALTYPAGPPSARTTWCTRRTRAPIRGSRRADPSSRR